MVGGGWLVYGTMSPEEERERLGSMGEDDGVG